MNAAAVRDFIQTARRRAALSPRPVARATLEVIATDCGRGLPTAEQLAEIRRALGQVPERITRALARRGCLVEAVGGSDLNGHKTTQASGGVGYGDSLQGTSIGFRRAIVAAGGLCPWRTALHEVAHCCDSLKWEADGRGRFSQTDEWTYIWLSAGCPDGDREEFFANAAARCWAGVFPGGEFIEALPDMVPP